MKTAIFYNGYPVVAPVDGGCVVDTGGYPGHKVVSRVREGLVRFAPAVECELLGGLIYLDGERLDGWKVVKERVA